jgi:hypothetical protein
LSETPTIGCAYLRAEIHFGGTAAFMIGLRSNFNSLDVKLEQQAVQNVNYIIVIVPCGDDGEMGWPLRNPDLRCLKQVRNTSNIPLAVDLFNPRAHGG